MAGRPAVLKVDIVADAKGVGNGVRQADRDLGGFSGKVQRHGKAIGLGLAAAGAAAFKFGKDSVAAFKESEQSAARLDDAYSRFPGLADKTRSSFDQLNGTLATKVKFDDDALASGEAVLAQYKLTGTQIQQLTPLLADYAAKTGKDIPEAAGVLGKALLGKGKALAEVGVRFKDAGSIGANYTQIMGGLRTQVGGFAEKEGKFAAGQAAILGNQFGEVQEQVGAKLLPVLTRLTTFMLSVISVVQRNSAVIGPLVVIIGGLAAGVFLVNKAAKAYAATQAALNVIMSLNPVALVVIAIAALAAGIVILYKRSETFRTGVKKLWDILKTFIGFSPFGLILTHLDEIWDKVKSVGDAIKNSPLGKLGGGVKGLFGGSAAPLATSERRLFGGSPGYGQQLGRLATAASGDTAWAGVLASVAGGALVLDQRDQRTVVRVDGALDPVAVAQQLRRVLGAADVRQGRTSSWGQPS